MIRTAILRLGKPDCLFIKPTLKQDTNISRDQFLLCTTRCPKVKVAVKIAELPSVIPVNKGPLVHAGASSEQDVSVLIPTVDKTATVNDSEFKCVLREEDKSNGVHENVCHVPEIWSFIPCVDQKTPNYNDFTKFICQSCATLDYFKRIIQLLQ